MGTGLPAPEAAGQRQRNSVQLPANRVSQRLGFKTEMYAKKLWPKARRERSLGQNSHNAEGRQ